MITDYHGTSGNRHKCLMLPERIEQQIESYGFEAREVIADKGYGRGPTYDHFRGKYTRIYIPLHTDALGAGRASRREFMTGGMIDTGVPTAIRYILTTNQ